MPRGIRKPNDETERAIAYIHGRIEAQIESQYERYAAALGVSAVWLAERINPLLFTAGSGLVDSMPTMRQGASSGGRTLEPLALVNNAHSNGSQAGSGNKTGKAGKNQVAAKQVRPHLSAKGRKAISLALKKRWADFHAGKGPAPRKGAKRNPDKAPKTVTA